MRIYPSPIQYPPTLQGYHANPSKTLSFMTQKPPTTTSGTQEPEEPANITSELVDGGVVDEVYSGADVVELLETHALAPS